MRARGRAIAAGVVVGVVALLAWAFWPRAVVVELGEVRRGPMAVTVVEPGQTRAVRTRWVTAPLAGALERILLDAGTVVHRGEVLATLRPLDSPLLDPRSREEATAQVRSAEAALRQSRAELERAQATARLARQNRTRMRALLRGGAAAAVDADRAEAEARAAGEAEQAAAEAVRGAQARLEAARSVLEQGTVEGGAIAVRSPIDGVVLRLADRREGPVVAGTQLMELGDLDHLEVYVDLLTPDAVQVAKGSRVVLRRWGGPGPLDATVVRVQPGGFTKLSALGVEEQRTWVVARIDAPFEQREGLGDGFRVEAELTLWSTQEAVQVPEGALFRRGGAWEVLVADGRRLAGRQVEVGERNGTAAQVLHGLSPGERVVVHPPEAARAGMRFRAP